MKQLTIVLYLLALFVEEKLCCYTYCAEGGMIMFQPSIKEDEKYVSLLS